MDKEKPEVFVIMPFESGFDGIYQMFIAEALTSAGYRVFEPTIF